ncbi:excalibur calcium-binding domain-containing protein [Frigoribacterium sp. CFBP9039]|uniref:excalibur calcium-binding domain-containing protein n=1 Tax=Frigoribacterium sp. CFBP9029 TaxID=3096541 RepID=UPI002A6A724A|nr:excalibur calcium-binding domain-containing protein [Frigoribacterium sp. CFBP9039]MDY0946565.1 excalibur calcium-binding domain-containing protein [Frigoribacterium sp. CFBP9039]
MPSTTFARTRVAFVAFAVTAGLTLGGGLTLGVGAPAYAAPKVYANCTAVNKAFSGGIAKPGIKVNLVTKANKTVEKRALKGSVKFDKALYAANAKHDRDKDGIACEKS